MRTYDCKPTLTDRQVLEFCKRGFLMLEGVVPELVLVRDLREELDALRTDLRASGVLAA